MPLELKNIHPGYAFGVLFVVFDLIILTLLDTTMARILSRLYLRRIKHGEPVRLRSVDIPGLTTFMLGENLISPWINLIPLFLKLLVLATILYVDLRLEARYDFITTDTTYTSTFVFNPSDSEWPYDRPVLRRVQRSWAQSRKCRFIPTFNRNIIEFYPLAFNLSNEYNGTLENDNEQTFLPNGTGNISSADVIPVDISSVQCLSPQFILNRNDTFNLNQSAIANVTGCMTTFNAPKHCHLHAPFNVSIELPFLISRYNRGVQRIPEGDKELTFQTFQFPVDVWGHAFPDDYGIAAGDASLYCTRSVFGPISRVSYKKRLTSCLFVIRRLDSTYVESWHYIENKDDNTTTSPYLQRDYAGAVFANDVPFGFFHSINYLQISIRQLDWLDMSSVLVAEGLIYQSKNITASVISSPKKQVVSFLPWSAVGLTLGLLIIAIVSRCFVHTDERPQINSIDGVSSIARVECTSSGRSMVRGPPVHVGLKVGRNGTLHFGPLQDPKTAVRPIKNVDII